MPGGEGYANLLKSISLNCYSYYWVSFEYLNYLSLTLMGCSLLAILSQNVYMLPLLSNANIQLSDANVVSIIMIN